MYTVVREVSQRKDKGEKSNMVVREVSQKEDECEL